MMSLINYYPHFNDGCILPAKRSRHGQDNHKTNGVTEVEATLFGKMVQDAGLHLNPGQTQDELGKQGFISKSANREKAQSIFRVHSLWTIQGCHLTLIKLAI